MEKVRREWMRKWYQHPAIVWPVLVAVCIPLFVWSWLGWQKSAISYAWGDTFEPAAEYARRITK